MGDIIRFPGQPPEEPPEDPRLAFRRREAERLAAFFVPGTSRVDREKTVEEVKEVEEAIDALIGSYSKETLRMRRELIGDMTPRQAAEIIQASSQKDWLTSPTYYKAVAERARHLI